ncbi:MAG: Trm112 family protein [Gammaproteobacteria bacterium]|nr:Trm112 family protein [Gammaproteobacteria bacterium]
MKKAIYDVLVCPACNGKLKMTKDGHHLLCSFDKLLFDINDNIPNMVIEQAKNLGTEEMEQLELR